MNQLLLASQDISFIEYIFHSNIINWIFVVGFVVWLAKKFELLAVIEKVQKGVIDKIKESEDVKKQKELLLYETSEKVKNVEKEAEQIVYEAKTFSKKLSEEIVSEAQNEVEEISKKTDKIIKAHNELAKTGLTSEISNAALKIAEEHIKQALDSELHNKFINEFIDDLDNLKITQ